MKNRADSENYIHANFVKFSPNTETHNYICAQGPKDNSIEDFWEMVMQQEVACIIMLCQFTEKEKPKCAVYYPVGKDAEVMFGGIRLLNKGTEEVTGVPSGTIVNNLEVHAG